MNPDQEYEVARSIFREMNDGIFVVRPSDLHILQVNPAAQRLTGRRRRELLGTPLTEILFSDQAPELATIIRACQTTSQTTSSDGYELAGEGGVCRPVHVSVSRIHLEPEPLGLILVRDIGPLKKVEQERVRLLTRMEHLQRLESLAVLAGGIAHEFNNLLTIILGYTNLALLELPPGSAVHGLLEEVERAAHRAADRTGQLLAYTGRAHVQDQMFDLSALASQALEEIRPRVKPYHTIQRDLASGLPTTQGDPGHIRQAITHLLHNALDALEYRGSRITIRTGSETVTDPEPLAIDLDHVPAPGLFVFCEVGDNGAGMEEQILTRIFEPFFTTHHTGRGLGLAVVQGVMRCSRGLIHVRSQLGQGSTIRLSFPVLEACKP